MSNAFTERAQRVILIAQEESKRLNHNYVGTEHVLLGLIYLGDGAVAEILSGLRVDLREVRRRVESIIGIGDSIITLGEIPFTPRAKRVLELAAEESEHIGQHYVGTEHLLLGCLRDGDGVAARVLNDMGLDFFRVREIVLAKLNVDSKQPAPEAPNSTCSCHPEDPADRIAAFLYTLATYDLPLDQVRNAIERANEIRSKSMDNKFYSQYRDLAEILLARSL